MKNIILQKTREDCGAACIANICRHYGKPIDIDKIRRLFQGGKRGASGLGIIHAAETLGFSCRGAISESKEIPKNIPMPFIAHAVRGSDNHYLVVYKSDSNYVYLADPSEGYKKINTEVFQKNWTGAFFILLPQPDFSEKSASSKGLTRFLPILRSHKKICAEILIASVILSFLGIISAFYFRFLIDEVLSSNLRETLTGFSVGFLGVIIFRSLLGLARNQLLMSMSYKIDTVLVYRYFEHVLHLPMRFFTGKKDRRACCKDERYCYDKAGYFRYGPDRCFRLLDAYFRSNIFNLPRFKSACCSPCACGGKFGFGMAVCKALSKNDKGQGLRRGRKTLLYC